VVTANDDVKPGMIGLARMGAGIPVRAIQPEASVLVDQWCADYPDPGACRIK
jgi:hypothetical protein